MVRVELSTEGDAQLLGEIVRAGADYIINRVLSVSKNVVDQVQAAEDASECGYDCVCEPESER